MNERIRQALAFAAAAMRDARGGGAAWNEEIGDGLTVADKVPVEAAILLMLAARVGVADAPLAELLAAAIRSDRAHLAIARRPQTASLFGLGHVSLTRAGFGDADFDELLRVPLSAEPDEKRRYHRLELGWVRAHLFGEPLPRVDDSIFDAPPPAKRDAYALAHALMYATDFGESIDAIPQRAGDVVDACIAHYLVTDDLDILAELLLCAAMLRRPHSSYARCAWKIIDGVWSKFGFLPSPRADAGEFASLDERGRTSYALRHTYHTTLMGGDVCALLLRHPPHGDARPAPRVFWKQIRPRLDERGLNVESLKYIKGLSMADVGAPLLDALLIHSDAEDIAELLALCERAGHRSITVDAATRRTASARSPAR